MTGPIFQLQVRGAICPCFLSGEQRNAYQAIRHVNRSCRRVQWQPSSSSKSGSFLGGFFGKGKSNNDNENEGPCVAVLVLKDSGGDGKPELFVNPITSTGGFKRNIKLRRVDKVSLENENEIVLYAKKQHGQTKELLRFLPLQYDPDDDDNNTDTPQLPLAPDIRNMLLHHFMVIVEWERQRSEEEYDDDDDDDDDQPNFLQARAQKAKHFATRELEMKRTKTDREKRKAQLVAQTGGMKYTALAMANQS